MSYDNEINNQLIRCVKRYSILRATCKCADFKPEGIESNYICFECDHALLLENTPEEFNLLKECPEI